MSRGPAVLLIAPFDDGLHAHSALRQRALERLGCTVTAVDLLRRPGLFARLSSGDLGSRLAKAVDQAAPDLVLVIGAQELGPDLVGDLRARRIATWVNWFPWDLRRADRAATLGVAYDDCFAVGTDVAARLQADLGRPVRVIPLAVDPSVYRPVRSRDQYRANVVFAGTASPRREELLTRVLEFGLAIWGPGWRQTSLRDYCRGELLVTEEFMRAYGGASVALNIHHVADHSTEPEAECNQRLFELAALGLPQVVDYRKDLAGYFTPDEDCYLYEDADSMRTQVEAALLDPASAAEKAERARAAALSRHTYMHRLLQLLRAVGMEPTRDEIPAAGPEV